MSDSLPNTDPTTNSRFTDLGGGMYSEAMAPMTVLQYDVNTMAARCSFHCVPFVNINGLYHQIGDNAMDSLDVDLSTEMDACYGAGLKDPFTGNDLGGFSNAGMMLKIKVIMDAKHNKRAADNAAAILLAQKKAQLAAVMGLLGNASISPASNGTTSSFTAVPTDLSVALTDTSVGADGQAIVGWGWIFGDGLGSSIEQNPTYTYSEAGSYLVTLVTTDAGGTRVYSTQTVDVTAPTPAPAPSP